MEAYQYKVSDFEGPLDLLLYLIEKNKVDIYNIPIVEITDQFNAYVREFETFDVNYASKFFVMAATLLQIKSRLLLPRPPELEEEEEDPQEVLIRQLVEYRQMKQFSTTMATLWERRCQMPGRERTPMPFTKQFSGKIEKSALYQAFRLGCIPNAAGDACDGDPLAEGNLQRSRIDAPRGNDFATDVTARAGVAYLSHLSHADRAGCRFFVCPGTAEAGQMLYLV